MPLHTLLNRLRALAGAAVLLAAAWPAAAHDYYADHFQIVHPWTLPAPAGAAQVGLYLRIVDIAADDRLIGATSPVADTVELRQAPHAAPADGERAGTAAIPLVAGRDLSFSPFTAHLVLRGVKPELHQGRQYPLLLLFEKAGSVPVDFVVGSH